MEETCDPDSRDENDDAKNTKLAELVTSQEIQEGKLRKRQKSYPQRVGDTVMIYHKMWTHQNHIRQCCLLGSYDYAMHFQR